MLSVLLRREGKSEKMVKKQYAPAAVFIFVQLVLYVLIFAVGGAMLRYLTVIFSFVFALIFLSKNKDSYLTATALLLTVGADCCLVMCEPREQLIGMIFFSLAQIAYAFRVDSMLESKRARSATLIIRICAIVAVEGVAIYVAGEAFDALAAISMFYFTNILLNAVIAMSHVARHPLFAIGMLCFVLCDIFVGMNTAVGVYFSVSEGSMLYLMAHPPIDMAWLFYVPSQTLISLSSLDGDSFINNIKRR